MRHAVRRCRDVQVPEWLNGLDDLPAAVSVTSDDLPGVHVSMDHQCIMWCNQVVVHVSGTLLELAASLRGQGAAEDSLAVLARRFRKANAHTATASAGMPWHRRTVAVWAVVHLPRLPALCAAAAVAVAHEARAPPAQAQPHSPTRATMCRAQTHLTHAASTRDGQQDACKHRALTAPASLLDYVGAAVQSSRRRSAVLVGACPATMRRYACSHAPRRYSRHTVACSARRSVERVQLCTISCCRTVGLSARPAARSRGDGGAAAVGVLALCR
jgi:hypothetical protein